MIESGIFFAINVIFHFTYSITLLFLLFLKLFIRIIYLLIFIICPTTLRFLIDCTTSLAAIAGAIKLTSIILRYSEVGPSATISEFKIYIYVRYEAYEVMSIMKRHNFFLFLFNFTILK